MSFDMKLKIKFAKDGIKFFRKILSRSFPTLFALKKNLKQGKSQIQINKAIKEDQADSEQINSFRFIKMFKSES